MEFLSVEFWTALFSIVIIDLFLAGDNAIVIGLAARNLKKEQQKKVIFYGTLGAVVIRSLLTLAVVWLLEIPFLMAVGGLLLLWIAYKLLVEEKDHGDVKAGDSIWAAIKTIVIADAVMGLDNVLAVAGAAHGSFVMVVLGLLISVPIVVWGSTLILKWVEKYPSIIYIGAAVLAWTASKMILGEPHWKGYFDDNLVLKYGLELTTIALVLLIGKWKKTSKKQEYKPELDANNS